MCKHNAKLIVFLDRLETLDDPKQSGHGLVGGLSGFWRYRVGKYRLICSVQDDVLVIEVIRIAKRDEVYG